jgi:hypothetical protein
VGELVGEPVGELVGEPVGELVGEFVGEPVEGLVDVAEELEAEPEMESLSGVGSEELLIASMVEKFPEAVGRNQT